MYSEYCSGLHGLEKNLVFYKLHDDGIFRFMFFKFWEKSPIVGEMYDIHYNDCDYDYVNMDFLPGEYVVFGIKRNSLENLAVKYTKYDDAKSTVIYLVKSDQQLPTKFEIEKPPIEFIDNFYKSQEIS